MKVDCQGLLSKTSDGITKFPSDMHLPTIYPDYINNTRACLDAAGWDVLTGGSTNPLRHILQSPQGLIPTRYLLR